MVFKTPYLIQYRNKLPYKPGIWGETHQVVINDGSTLQLDDYTGLIYILGKNNATSTKYIMIQTPADGNVYLYKGVPAGGSKGVPPVLVVNNTISISPSAQSVDLKLNILYIDLEVDEDNKVKTVVSSSTASYVHDLSDGVYLLQMWVVALTTTDVQFEIQCYDDNSAVWSTIYSNTFGTFPPELPPLALSIKRNVRFSNVNAANATHILHAIKIA